MWLKLVIVCSLLLHVNSFRLPFNKTLLNKKYESALAPPEYCGYPRVDTQSLTINKWSLTYVPRINNDGRGAWYQGFWFCQGEIKLYYANRPNHMKITKFPTKTKPFKTKSNGEPADDQGPSCAELQPKQTVWPWGPTREEYKKIFKELFDGAVSIKNADKSCRASNETPDEAVSFLYAIAYDYFISVQ